MGGGGGPRPAALSQQLEDAKEKNAQLSAEVAKQKVAYKNATFAVI